MSLPLVAIVGRPNVGKSSLFNWLIGKRISIVDPTSGVTRDRVDHPFRVGDYRLLLTDTGGMGVIDRDGLTDHIEAQIAYAMNEAVLVLFVVDGQTGVTDLDRVVNDRLYHLKKPVVCVANKCDDERFEHQVGDFFRLGREQVLPVSVTRNRRRQDLLDAIQAKLDELQLPTTISDRPPSRMKLAVVGRRNVGKSTFINALAGEERVIVSEVAGTTRDSIDVHFEMNGQHFIAIDTAGVRKKKSLADDVEFYSLNRAQKSIARADVVLHFLAAPDEISQVDKQLVSFIVDQYKPVIFAINKWDIIKDKTSTQEFSEYIDATFPNLDFAPRVFLTAKDSKNLQATVDLATTLHKQALSRLSTGEMNRLLREAIDRRRPSLRKNRAGKIYYGAQVDIQPPTIRLSCNDPELLDKSWRRYLVNYLRERVPYPEIPIRIDYRGRESEKKE